MSSQQDELDLHDDDPRNVVELYLMDGESVPCEWTEQDGRLNLSLDPTVLVSPLMKATAFALRSAAAAYAGVTDGDVNIKCQLGVDRATSSVRRLWVVRLPACAKPLAELPRFRERIEEFASATGKEREGSDKRPDQNDAMDSVLAAAIALQQSLHGPRTHRTPVSIHCPLWAAPVEVPTTVAGKLAPKDGKSEGELKVRVTGSDWHMRQVRVLPDRRQSGIVMSYDQARFEEAVEDARLHRRNQYKASYSVIERDGKPTQWTLTGLSLVQQDYFGDHADDETPDS